LTHTNKHTHIHTHACWHCQPPHLSSSLCCPPLCQLVNRVKNQWTPGGALAVNDLRGHY